jgi:hypothetical protein
MRAAPPRRVALRPVVVVLVLALLGCGDPRADGPPTLGAVATSRAGCIDIRTGRDGDGDGRLGDDEVTTTTELCAPETPPRCGGGKTLDGPVVIAAAADWDRLAGVACIDGDLVIAGIDDGELHSLAPLQRVTGNVAIAGDPYLTTLSALAGVTTIGGTLLVQGDDELADLDGAGTIAQLAELDVIDNAHLPDLQGLEPLGCATALRVSDDPELASLTGLDDHRCIGALSLARLPALASVEALDRLTDAEALDLDDVPVPARCFPALTAVAGQLRIADEAMPTLELPALRSVGSLDLEGNALLQVVDAPWLRDVSELYVARDRALAALRFDMTGAETITLEELPALQLLQLGAIDQISHDLDIEHTGLADFRGFALVSKIGGDLTLHANAATSAVEHAFADRIEIDGQRSIDP